MNKSLGFIAGALVFIGIALFVNPQPAYAAINCSDPGVVCKGGILPGSETWTAGNIYVITGSDVIVPSEATLTIQAGAIVKLDAYYLALIVDGNLVVTGEAGNRVYFTSSKDDTLGGDTNHDTSTPEAGNWDAVYFRGGSSGTLSYVEFRYGNNPIYMDGGTNVAVDHSLFKNASTCAINSSPGYEPSLADMAPGDFTGSTNNGLCIRGEALDVNAAWDETEATYVLLNDVTVTSGFTLTWGPGIVVKPQAYYMGLIVDGVLNANGTDSQPIYVTSFQDDTVGGQTNNNTNPPEAGNWDGIHFRVGGGGVLQHVVLRYASYAVNLEDASPHLQNCTLWHNVRGIHSTGALSNPVLSNCSIYDNQEYGIYNAQPGHWIEAAYTWWGSPSGPYDPSPPGTDNDYNAGSGDRVNDYVRYRPWVIITTNVYQIHLPLVMD